MCASALPPSGWSEPIYPVTEEKRRCNRGFRERAAFAVDKDKGRPWGLLASGLASCRLLFSPPHEGLPVDFDQYNELHLPAVILKTFLRELPEPLLTFDLYPHVVGFLSEFSFLPSHANPPELSSWCMCVCLCVYVSVCAETAPRKLSRGSREALYQGFQS